MEINRLDLGKKERDLLYNTKPYLSPGFGINNRFGMGKIERDILLNRYHDDKSVLREINQLNYKNNNLDLFLKQNLIKVQDLKKMDLIQEKRKVIYFLMDAMKKMN